MLCIGKSLWLSCLSFIWIQSVLLVGFFCGSFKLAMSTVLAAGHLQMQVTGGRLLKLLLQLSPAAFVVLPRSEREGSFTAANCVKQ